MSRRRGEVAATALMVLALAGCHTTRGKVPEAATAAEGRAERAFAAPLRPTLTAALGALDDARVRPRKLIIHGAAEGGGKPPALAIEPAEANLAMLPDGARADDVFVQHLLRLPGAPPTPFVPIFVTYQGKAPDGRVVTLTIATRRGDEANQLVTIQPDRRGDLNWSDALLEKVAVRLRPAAEGPAPAPAGPPAPP